MWWDENYGAVPCSCLQLIWEGSSPLVLGEVVVSTIFPPTHYVPDVTESSATSQLIGKKNSSNRRVVGCRSGNPLFLEPAPWFCPHGTAWATSPPTVGINQLSWSASSVGCTRPSVTPSSTTSTSCSAQADEDVMLFTASKLSGHAGSRFGWVLSWAQLLCRSTTFRVTQLSCCVTNLCKGGR
jgi:hypothetical protein